MSDIEKREHELTANLGREKFDWLPEDVTNKKDQQRWFDFIEKYQYAQELKYGDYPLQIDFELNSLCNMRCRFCVHGQTKVEKNLLSFEDFCKVIDESKKYGLVSIKMNYINEPLLVRDLERYIKYARDNGVLNVYFATNGTLLTRKRSQSLIEAGVTKIMVSLDSTSSEMFQRMRQSNQYDRIVKNIYDFIDVRNNMGKVFPLLRVNFLKTEINEEQAITFLEKWKDTSDMIGYQVQVAVPNDTQKVKHENSKDFSCSFPFKLLVVDSQGDILPCCTFSGRKLPLGNIKETSIFKAWNSKKINELRTIHIQKEYYKNEICKHCINGCS